MITQAFCLSGGGSAPLLLRLERWGYKVARQLGSEVAKCNILISPLEGEKKFLSELCELRNFREGYKKYKTLDRATKCAIVRVGDKKGKIIMNKNNLQPKQPNNPTTFPENKHSLLPDTVFSRFTSHFSRKRIAFTLAEVLITLGIIGVVAALTLPSLIAKYKDMVLLNQAKNSYSKIANALLLLKNQNGYDSYADFFSPNKTNDEIIQELSSVMKMTKICKKGVGGCWTWKTKPAKEEYYANGELRWAKFNAQSCAILSDGSVISVYNYNKNGNCVWVNTYPSVDKDGNPRKDENGNTIIINSVETRCGDINIDVNGPKAPNQRGADTWGLSVYPDKIGDKYNSFLSKNKLDYEKYIPNEKIK